MWQERGRVVMMNGRGKSSGSAYAPLQEVRAYWEGLRDGSRLPARASIDPRGLERGLEHVFLLERVAMGEARFRLAGMHLTMIMGMEVRGLPFSAVFDQGARPQIQDLLETVFSGRATIELALEAERGIGRPALEGRVVLLPVIGDDGECNRALGCLVSVGAIGRNPRRFAVTRQAILDLEPAASRTATTPEFVASGFAEPTATYRASHLRLVKSDTGSPQK
jgi:hypothetical protein